MSNRCCRSKTRWSARQEVIRSSRLRARFNRGRRALRLNGCTGRGGSVRRSFEGEGLDGIQLKSTFSVRLRLKPWPSWSLHLHLHLRLRLCLCFVACARGKSDGNRNRNRNRQRNQRFGRDLSLDRCGCYSWSSVERPEHGAEPVGREESTRMRR